MSYAFAEYVLDTDRVELRKDGTPVPLEPKAYRLLQLLLENRDRVLSRDEIFDQVWPGVFVSEASLSTAIKQIRRALDDDGQRQGFIRTIRGHGFRFVAPARPAGAAPPVASAEPAPPAPPTRAPSGPPVIAVLPFALIGTDALHSAIAEAIPAELIATLSQQKWAKVIARGSAFRFADTDAPYDEIRAKLGATYVLSGSVELSGTRLTIVTDLVDARSHQVIWSEPFTGSIDEVFDLRARITHAIANVLEFRLSMHEAEMLIRVPSENLDAWGHYHLGMRAMYHYTQANNAQASGHFARALELDPRFGRAHAALSYTEFQNYAQQFGPEFDHHRDLALDHAETAVDLDPFDPYGNLMLGRAHWIGGDAETGLGWIDRSLHHAPNYFFAFYNSGLLNTLLGDGERGDADMAAAMARSPLDPHTQTMIGMRALAAYARGDTRMALKHAEATLRTRNAHFHIYLLAAAVQELLGHGDKARDAIARIKAKGTILPQTGHLTLFKPYDTEKRALLDGALTRLAS